MTRLLAALLPLALAACAAAPKKPPPPPAAAQALAPDKAVQSSVVKKSPYAPAQEDLSKRGHYQAGGLYAAHIPDSTPDEIPDVDAIPEPEVAHEPRSRVGNRSTYAVLGKQYHVLEDAKDYVEEGLASYYGNKFHGRRTSNMEVYDMYAFTAAHKTLPLPSFARVTNRDNGKSVVVRVNDRGPFHDGRVIDLSYAAAVKLGITQRGTGRVEVRALTPGSDASRSFARAPTAAPPPASTLDKLVAAIPMASAHAGELPPGVRIATGLPTPTATAAMAEPAATAMSAPTTAVVTAPGRAVQSTVAPATAPWDASTGSDYRFDMRQDGKAMSADEFQAWMTSRQVRVATGKPGTPGPRVAAVVQPPVPRNAPATVSTLVGTAPAGGVTWQVASFSARGNADRALAMLQGAGIDGARLNDADANGQKVWRLRVGPLDATAGPALAARIVGLGFGPPQRVRE